MLIILYTFTSMYKFSLMLSVHFLRCWQGEFVQQTELLKLEIISFILMILMNNTAVLLWGEIRCWSLLGFKRLGDWEFGILWIQLTQVYFKLIDPTQGLTLGLKIFTSSSRKSFFAISRWNLWPQFLTQVSSTWKRFITKRNLGSWQKGMKLNR